MFTPHILHLEDNPTDAELAEDILKKNNIAMNILPARTEEEFLRHLERKDLAVILSDNRIPGYDGHAALKAARARHPDTPFIFVSSSRDDNAAAGYLRSGAADYVFKDELWRLPFAIRNAHSKSLSAKPAAASDFRSSQNVTRLLQAVIDLSSVRSLNEITAIVRTAARQLVNADGATFVLRDGDLCFYADEDAIQPLWKGKRFPMSACISGWVMHNRAQAMIDDIYQDDRIPHDAYRPTFVKSLVMTPVRVSQPIAAIGVYWAINHDATSDEANLLQLLADTTAVALENVRLVQTLERRVEERTAQLQSANKELEAFAYSVSHDLGAPIRAIDGFSEILLEENRDTLTPAAVARVNQVRAGAKRMSTLIADMLKLFKLSQHEMLAIEIDLSLMCRKILETLQSAEPSRRVEVSITPGLRAWGDSGLLWAALQNLLGNAWKYSGKKDLAKIEVGITEIDPGTKAFFVRDNGAGFDMRYASKLFAPFQRFHAEKEFSGTGVGLAVVNRIINRHGGRLWAKSAPGEGATFFFTLPPKPQEP
ncbi:MAG: ATP-binding protein [Nibricoccus sp.]